VLLGFVFHGSVHHQLTALHQTAATTKAEDNNTRHNTARHGMQCISRNHNIIQYIQSLTALLIDETTFNKSRAGCIHTTRQQLIQHVNADRGSCVLGFYMPDSQDGRLQD
jgi:uncharacterized membrane protein YccC